jgi:hypothetical protein
MVVTAAGANITISFNKTQPLAAGDFLQIQQVRLNVAGVTGPQLVNGTQTFLATISGNSPNANTITFNQNQIQVALIQNSMNVKLGAAGAVSTCNVLGGLGFSVTATEVYPAAITSATDENTFTPGIPLASLNGSSITVVLSNVPSGFVITPAASTVPATITMGAVPAAQTSASAATPLSFTFPVTLTSTSAVEAITFNFGIGLAAGTIAPTLASQSLASPQSITAQLNLAPVSNTASTIVRFSQLSYPATPITVATVSDCVSILLFPYVTNEAGFDTSIQIANTTLDGAALGVQTASKQPGTCKLILYPTAAATGAVGTTQNSFVTPTLAAGGSYQVLLSKAYPKLSGYMFAVCNFLNAHGFGYFVGPSSNGGVLTQGALALVVPTTRNTGALAGVPETLTQ